MYHMLRLRTGYLTVVPHNSKPCYVCFRYNVDATNCRKYINDHKRYYNSWPNMDMNMEFNKLELNENKFSDVSSVISVEDIDKQKFKDIAALSLCSMLICTDFVVDTCDQDNNEIHFKGFEVEYKFDTETIIKILNK